MKAWQMRWCADKALSLDSGMCKHFWLKESARDVGEGLVRVALHCPWCDRWRVEIISKGGKDANS